MRMEGGACGMEGSSSSPWTPRAGLGDPSSGGGHVAMN